MPGQDFLTFKTRERTICIDIHAAHPQKRAPWKEWTQFLIEDLQVEPLEVLEVGVHTLTRLLMLQLASDNEYHRMLSKVQDGVLWSCHQSIVYGWSHQEKMTSVKLMNVTKSLNLEKLRTKMSEYGTIISWTLGSHPQFRNSFDNTINVKLMMKNGTKLPAFLPSASMGEVIHLISDSIEKACMKCLATGHIAPQCRKNGKNFRGTSKVWEALPEMDDQEEATMETDADTQVDGGIEMPPSQSLLTQESQESNATSTLNTQDLEDIDQLEQEEIQKRMSNVEAGFSDISNRLDAIQQPGNETVLEDNMDLPDDDEEFPLLTSSSPMTKTPKRNLASPTIAQQPPIKKTGGAFKVNPTPNLNRPRRNSVNKQSTSSTASCSN